MELSCPQRMNETLNCCYEAMYLGNKTHPPAWRFLGFVKAPAY
jgi:hypothetical protein